ncbi:hypothetical protein BWI96_12335 [Siphonobacter sp. SORGH_AS_0500]|uniref:energy transducer TonB n=1 Tax=Siphonobacter sp. SORGH_AS_0500 TaxID=1864824 RepID=UPI000CB80A21|nr:energy transducer TonB [Siphonobacter sp. SORGH_AS_0500]PKK36194.1 hypothetical protein BWI96_12335 [Siphonobacter sp. SORGH_AS_0500]
MAKRPIDITPDLLRRYVAGEANAQEQHAVERAALEDPFIADALEGFEAMAEKKPDLKALYDQLDNRVSPTPILQLGWKKWALAASFIGLLLTGYVLWLQLDSTPEISQVTAPTASPQTQSTDSLLTPEASQPEISLAEAPRVEALTKKPLVSADALAEDEKPQVMAMRAAPPTDSQTLAKMPALAARSFQLPDSGFAKNKQTPDTISLALPGKATGVNIAARTDTPLARKVDTENQKNLITIVDEGKNPIPGVMIQNKDGRKGVVTDSMGRAFIPNTLGPEIVLALIGYKNQTLQAPFPSVITLQADNEALSEVVVVEYGKTKRKTEAEPVMGSEAYKTYLQENLRKPELAKEKGISGTVILSVQIKDDGRIGTIKVRKGLGYGCDEEAIRLVKEGPEWKPARRKGKSVSSTVRVEVRFF